MIEIEFIGTGGQGSVVAGKLLADAAAKAGLKSQAFAIYGASRRGGGVESFVRISEDEVLNHSKIYGADYTILMEPSLLEGAQERGKFKKGSTVLINTPDSLEAFPTLKDNKVITIDANHIANNRGVTLPNGMPIINTTMIGALWALLPSVTVDQLIESLKDGHIPAFEKNVDAVNDAYVIIKGTGKLASKEVKEVVAVKERPVGGERIPEYRPKLPPCEANCPAGEKIERTVLFVQYGRFEKALENIKVENPFPGICGRICFHPCETNCNRVQFDEGIATKALERAAFDYADSELVMKLEKKPSTGKKVAVIGSGPAGMTCAYYLTLLGHNVTVFEAQPVAGGMPRYGIPEYRLPGKVVDREIKEIVDLGVTIKVNTMVGKDITFDIVTKEHDACFIAAGAHRSMKLGIPGENSDGVLYGLDFLKRIKAGEKVNIGKKVAVIGGGNSAIDSARTAKRLGADEVTVVVSCPPEEMRAHALINEERCTGCKLCIEPCPCKAITLDEKKKLAVINESLCKGCGACAIACNRGAVTRLSFTTEEDVATVEEEGIKILYLAKPVKIHNEGKYVSGIECIKEKSGEKGKDGRRILEPIIDSNFTINVDTVIDASGEALELPFPDGTVNMAGPVIAVDNLGSTSVAGVYAGGDVTSLSRSVVEAVASGKRAALGIDIYLSNSPQNKAGQFRKGRTGSISMSRYLSDDPKSEGNEVVAFNKLNTAYFTEAPRAKVKNAQVKARLKDFRETSLGFSKESAISEAERCFHCGTCTVCEVCYLMCPDMTISLSINGPSFIEDGYTYCKSCGICIRECPRNAISWKGAR